LIFILVKIFRFNSIFRKSFSSVIFLIFVFVIFYESFRRVCPYQSSKKILSNISILIKNLIYYGNLIFDQNFDFRQNFWRIFQLCSWQVAALNGCGWRCSFLEDHVMAPFDFCPIEVSPIVRVVYYYVLVEVTFLSSDLRRFLGQAFK